MAIILAAALTLTPVAAADVWLTERLEHEDLSVRLLDQWRELTDVPRETSRDSAVPATRSTTTTTRPPPTAVPEGVEQWRPLVEAHFPTDAVDRMLCLMWHESRGNPSARNPNSTATGLLQVMHSVWGDHFGVTRTDLEDPETNMRIARQIWDQQGYRAWSPFNRGLCR